MGKAYRLTNEVTDTVIHSIPRSVLNWDDELHTPIEDFQDNLACEIYLQLLRNASNTVSIVPEVEAKLLGNNLYLEFNYFYKREINTVFIDTETFHLNSSAVSLLLETIRVDVNILSEVELYLKFNQIDIFH